MEKKEKSLSFRVPMELREAIDWASEREGKSKANYMMDSTWQLIESAMNDGRIKDLMLPEGYEIPSDSKMYTIRVTNEFAERVQEVAPRFYHSATRLMLWASTVRAFQLGEEFEAEQQQATDA